MVYHFSNANTFTKSVTIFSISHALLENNNMLDENMKVLAHEKKSACCDQRNTLFLYHVFLLQYVTCIEHKMRNNPINGNEIDTALSIHFKITTNQQRNFVVRLPFMNEKINVGVGC